MSDPVANGNSSVYIDRSPERAVEEYIKDRQGQRQRSTLKSDKGHLSVFVNWCDEHDVRSMADLRSKHLTEYWVYRRERHDLKTATRRHHKQTLRMFLQWAANQLYCSRRLHDHVRDLDPSGSTKSRESHLPPAYGNQIVDYLRNNRHGSERHAVVEIGWSTGLRPGSIRSLDVGDVHFEDKYIELEHRPDTGTPLKHGSESERVVAIPEQVATAIRSWISNPKRRDITDKYDRRPLFPAHHGRRQQSSIGDILRIRPYQYLDVSPPNMKSKAPFDAESHSAVALNCPPCVSPHTLRKSVAMRQLRNGIAIQKIASRMDCSEKVLRKWYDRLNEVTEMEHRRDEFDAEYE